MYCIDPKNIAINNADKIPALGEFRNFREIGKGNILGKNMIH
jgi:hypothetical protein